MTPDDVLARIAPRPPEEPLTEAIAHAAYWSLVEFQEPGGSSPERAAMIRDFADVKAELLAALAEVTG